MSSTAAPRFSGFPCLGDLQPLPLPERDHRISLEDAAEATRAHRHDPILLERPLAFRREALEQLLAQPGCMGVRIYPAHHDGVNATLVVVGVDAMGKDMVTGLLMNEPFLCPDQCPEENPLNMD